MKSKIFSALAITTILFSCATKTVPTPPATPQVSNEEKAQKGLVTAETNFEQPKVNSKVEMSKKFEIGKDIYQNNCAKCHVLYAAKEFKKEEWSIILVKMQRKAKLDDTQMELISSYIYTQL